MRMVKSVDATRSTRSRRACITSLEPTRGTIASGTAGTTLLVRCHAPRSASNTSAARLAALSRSWHVHSSGRVSGSRLASSMT